MIVFFLTGSLVTGLESTALAEVDEPAAEELPADSGVGDDDVSSFIRSNESEDDESSDAETSAVLPEAFPWTSASKPVSKLVI